MSQDEMGQLIRATWEKILKQNADPKWAVKRAYAEHLEEKKKRNGEVGEKETK